MLKRRLTLIFKVDNPLRMIRCAISGCDEIMRNFNILQHDRRQNEFRFRRWIFFAPTRAANAKDSGIATIANNVFIKTARG
jgi:hypothetical protein